MKYISYFNVSFEQMCINVYYFLFHEHCKQRVFVSILWCTNIICVCECVNAILWGTACNCNILCGVLFLCGVKNMYPTIFSVKLFPECHLPPIIRSPRNTPQYFFWKCVYFYTLFKLYTPPRTQNTPQGII